MDAGPDPGHEEELGDPSLAFLQRKLVTVRANDLVAAGFDFTPGDPVLLFLPQSKSHPGRVLRTQFEKDPHLLP